MWRGNVFVAILWCFMAGTSFRISPGPRDNIRLNIVEDSNFSARFGGINVLYGSGSLENLRRSHVLVIGLGGVGSWACEALARSGVGTLTLVDADDTCSSNINRQLQALSSTVGVFKADTLKARALDINPDAKIVAIIDFVTSANVMAVLKDSSCTAPLSMVLDCTDSIDDKAAIIDSCASLRIPVITSGGVGGLTDTAMLTVSDLAYSHGDRLTSMVRKRLRREYGYPKGVPYKSSKRKQKRWVLSVRQKHLLLFFSLTYPYFNRFPNTGGILMLFKLCLLAASGMCMRPRRKLAVGQGAFANATPPSARLVMSLVLRGL
jgi:tRNA A37 threonylcarbamoyladenosine dehydratase